MYRRARTTCRGLFGRAARLWDITLLVVVRGVADRCPWFPNNRSLTLTNCYSQGERESLKPIAEAVPVVV